MDKSHSKTQRKAVLDSLLLESSGVVAGKMFGHPAYYINRKLFACIYGSGVGVKVPEELANQLLSRKQVAPFQPEGKPKMKEWVQINRPSPADYKKDIGIFRASIDFVRQLDKADGKSRQ
jgi:hypothetical protein